MSEAEQQSPTVYDHLAIILDQMGGVAWQKLGLQPDMVTGKVEAHMDEARVAIDVVSFIVGKLEPQLDEDDKRSIQGLVRDLKVNYVQKGGN